MNLSTLSKREKVLLYVLALIGILFGSLTYIITPTLEDSREAKLAYVAAQEEKEQMEILMPKLIGADERLAAEKERMTQDQYFYKDLIDTQIDWLIQRVAGNSGGVELHRVTINPAQIGPVAQPIEENAAEDSDLLTQFVERIGSGEKKEDESNASTLTQTLYNCSFELWGSVDGCMAALDQFSGMEHSVLVDHFEIKYDTKEQMYIANINLIFYFAE